jgi:ABC-type branched-subunit amino acid transport system ATPase component
MSDNVIETHGLTKYFGHEKVVDTLELAVPRGTVYGFLGRNGADKTTTLRQRQSPKGADPSTWERWIEQNGPYILVRIGVLGRHG